LTVSNFDVYILTVSNLYVNILTVGNLDIDILTVGNLDVYILMVGILDVDHGTLRHKKKKKPPRGKQTKATDGKPFFRPRRRRSNQQAAFGELSRNSPNFKSTNVLL
jgi:hypothetical protein